MLNQDQFERLTERIVQLGHDESTAADFAARIGDTPEIDGAGLTIVRNDAGDIVARLPLEC